MTKICGNCWSKVKLRVLSLQQQSKRAENYNISFYLIKDFIKYSANFGIKVVSKSFVGHEIDIKPVMSWLWLIQSN